MIYSHFCPVCNYKGEDAERLIVCPDCASDLITNDLPLGTDDNFQEDSSGKVKLPPKEDYEERN